MTGTTATAMMVGRSGAEEGQGTVRSAICTAGVPAAEMACGVEPGRSVLERSNVLANWATDIGCLVGRGGGNLAGEAEDVLSAIADSGGGGGAIASTWGGRQRRSP